MRKVKITYCNENYLKGVFIIISVLLFNLTPLAAKQNRSCAQLAAAHMADAAKCSSCLTYSDRVLTNIREQGAPGSRCPSRTKAQRENNPLSCEGINLDGKVVTFWYAKNMPNGLKTASEQGDCE